MLGQLDLASQSVFAGRYRVVRRIASGGMGAVFEVVHLETQRRRALKVMLPELLENRQLRERFQMEARITANVETEYIVDVFDAGIDDATGMPFLVMELLNGEDLSKLIDRSGPLAPELVVTYLRQVASALDKTHAAGIVHRDLKPENLFLTHREDGTPRVKILDFGISKVVSEANTGASATRGIGTPLYMAPEQVLAHTVSGATDLYALGLIAYTLLVGVPYWQADVDRFDNPISFVVHTSKGITESASSRALQVGHALSPTFDAWFRRATDVSTERRFGSATELVRELASALGFALPTFSQALGPDSSGSFVRSGPGPSAETMVARTAPGTEFDRRSSSSGVAGRSKLGLWIGLCLAALVAAGVLLVALRNAPPAAAGGPVGPAANPATVAATPRPEPAAAPAPSNSAAGVPIAPTAPLPDPVPTPTAAARAVARPKKTSSTSAPTQRAAPLTRPAATPKYTRD